MILATGPKARARGGRAAAAVTARALAVASRVRSLAALASRAHSTLPVHVLRRVSCYLPGTYRT